MERLSEPKIVGVDKLPNGILVTFEDEKLAIFSAALLYATLPMAQRVVPDDDLASEE
jgi:hypothetical protein